MFKPPKINTLYQFVYVTQSLCSLVRSSTLLAPLVRIRTGTNVFTKKNEMGYSNCGDYFTGGR